MVRHDAVEAFGNPIFVSNHDDRLEQYKKLVAAAKANGSLFISQLSHVGRQGGKALNPNPVSASDVQLQVKWAGNEFAKPRALEVDEIKEIVGNFADSAYWCWKAGYDGVQVSCAFLQVSELRDFKSHCQSLHFSASYSSTEFMPSPNAGLGRRVRAQIGTPSGFPIQKSCCDHQANEQIRQS